MILTPEIEKSLKQSISFKFNGKDIPIIPFNDVRIYNNFRFWLASQNDDTNVIQAIGDYIKLCEASIKTTYGEGNIKNIIFDITGDISVEYEITPDTGIRVLGLKDPSKVKSLLESMYMIKSEVSDNKLEIKIVLPDWEVQ